MTKTNFLRLVSVFLICVIAFSITEVYATGDTQSDAIGDEVTVTFFFAFFRGEPNLSFTNIKNIFWKDRKVNVLGYSGSYVYVEDIETEDKGYIHNWLINDKRLNITQQYVDVYSGDSKNGVVTIKYDKDAALEWSVSKSGIVEVTKHSSRSLSIKGLSPGTVKLTVKCGDDKDTCDISAITNKCSNIFCATCYIGTIPEGCIMYDRVDVESVTLTEIYCDDCKDTILNCIERF